MNRAFLFTAGLAFVALASIGHALFAAAAPAIALVREVFAVAFPASAIAARDTIPSLISTETFRQGVDRAQTDSFVARRANRLAAGRGSGDPCLGLAIAA